MGEEYPAAQHLNRREPLVGRFAARYLAQEIAGECLKRRHAPIVIDEHLPESLSLGGCEVGACLRPGGEGMERGDEQEQSHSGALSQRAAQHAPGRGEPQDEREEQQRVAGVGHGRTIGIVVGRERRALGILVVGGLIEAHAGAFQDLVHRDGSGVGRSVGGRDAQLTGVVGGQVGTGIVRDIEAEQCNGEGQPDGRAAGVIVDDEGSRRLARPEVDVSATPCDVGQQRAGEDEQQRGVEQGGHGPPPDATPDEAGHSAQSSHGPKNREPQAAVDLSVHKIGALVFFHESDRSHNRADYEEEAEGNARGFVRSDLHFHNAKLLSFRDSANTHNR